MARAHLVIPDGRSAETTSFGPKFGFDTLPEAEQHIAEPFAVCARAVIDALPDSPMLSKTLVYLLQARQDAVRAVRAGGFVRVADGSLLRLEPAAPVLLQSPAQALGYEPIPGSYPEGTYAVPVHPANQVGTVEQQPAVDRAALDAGHIGGFDPATDRVEG